MAYLALLIERAEWLGTNRLAARCRHLLERGPVARCLDRRADHRAAVVNLADDAVGLVPVVSVGRDLAPRRRASLDRAILQHIGVAVDP